jgi:hypothetical protein
MEGTAVAYRGQSLNSPLSLAKEAEAARGLRAPQALKRGDIFSGFCGTLRLLSLARGKLKD